MKTFFKAIILVPIAVVVLAFAYANRQTASVSFDPFNMDAPAFAVSGPLFIVLFATILVGILIGGVASWLSQGRSRRAAREAKAECVRLREQVARLTPAPGRETGQGPGSEPGTNIRPFSRNTTAA